MKTIVIILGLLVGQVYAQSVRLDRIVNIVQYPSSDKWYSRIGRFPFDSVSIPKYCDNSRAVINTKNKRYIQRKFDFNKKKVYTIFNERFFFRADSITSIKALDDHTIEVILFIPSKEIQLQDPYVPNKGEIVSYEAFIIDLKDNVVTYNYYSVWNNKFYSGVVIEKTLDKLHLNVVKFD